MTMSNATGGYQPPSGSGTTSGTTPGVTSGTTSGTAQTAKDEAANVGQTAKDATGQVASTAADQANQVAQETRRQASDLISQAGSQVSEQAGSQKEKAVGGLRSLSDELRSMAEGNGAQAGMVGDLARQAADKAQEFAGWLDQRDPGSLIEEVRSLARRRPGAFLLGAAIAGVAAGRLTRGAVAANSSSGSDTYSTGTGMGAMEYGAPDRAGTAVYTSTSPGAEDSFTGQDATGMRNPGTGPLVVEPERTPARQGATGGGLGMEEERR
jgi:hypothetical protein